MNNEIFTPEFIRKERKTVTDKNYLAALETIESLQSDAAKLAAALVDFQWIPISEPPAKPGRYVVTAKYNDFPAKPDAWSEQCIYDGQHWEMYDSLITHWMPLPPPPEETN